MSFNFNLIVELQHHGHASKPTILSLALIADITLFPFRAKQTKEIHALFQIRNRMAHIPLFKENLHLWLSFQNLRIKNVK